jgi:hypothetical protein
MFFGGQLGGHDIGYNLRCGHRYTLTGALHQSEVDGYWHIGLHIALSRLDFIQIEFCLSEKDGKVMVKAGAEDKPRALDLSDEGQCRQFYDEIAEDIKRYFTSEPVLDEGASLRRIGFQSSTSQVGQTL